MRQVRGMINARDARLCAALVEKHTAVSNVCTGDVPSANAYVMFPISVPLSVREPRPCMQCQTSSPNVLIPIASYTVGRGGGANLPMQARRVHCLHTQTSIFLGAESRRRMLCGMCSTVTLSTCTGSDNAMTTCPREPPNAQQLPTLTSGYGAEAINWHEATTRVKMYIIRATNIVKLKQQVHVSWTHMCTITMMYFDIAPGHQAVHATVRNVHQRRRSAELMLAMTKQCNKSIGHRLWARQWPITTHLDDGARFLARVHAKQSLEVRLAERSACEHGYSVRGKSRYLRFFKRKHPPR
jgi:hypothetical protein